MVDTAYQRTFITTCPGELIAAINSDASITPVVFQIINDSINSPGISEFWFDNPLSAPEIVAFDAILSGWTCPTGSINDGNPDFENAVVYTFDHNKLKNRSWLGTGGTKSATAGYTMPFNATLIGITYHVASGTSRDLDLYVDDVFDSTIITASPGDSSDTTLNINIDANQRIQLRGGSGGGNTNNVVVSLYVTWR